MFLKPIPKILEEANNIQDSDERALYMKKYMRVSVAKVLAIFHNDDIEFDRFKDIKYSTKHNREGIADSSLEHELKRIYIFQKKNPLAYDRKKVRLVQVLESMYDKESEFMMNNLIMQKNPYKNLNKHFIKKHFPRILTLDIDRI